MVDFRIGNYLLKPFTIHTKGLMEAYLREVHSSILRNEDFTPPSANEVIRPDEQYKLCLGDKSGKVTERIREVLK